MRLSPRVARGNWPVVIALDVECAAIATSCELGKTLLDRLVDGQKFIKKQKLLK